MDSPKKHPAHINYLYFGGFFLLLTFLAAGSIFTKENLNGSQFFFFLYAIGQITLETTFFVFLGYMIHRFMGKGSFYLFIGGTFMILLLHMIDFLMDRLLDLSVWETLKAFILDESFENFLLLLQASGIPPFAWICIFSALLVLPLLGIFLYRVTDQIAQKKSFIFKQNWYLQTFLCIPFALLFWDFSASKVIHPNAYTALIKSLPWKVTLLQPENILLHLPGPIPAPISEWRMTEKIEENRSVIRTRPNIYLFVVESLREDCITEESAPHLTQFKSDHTHFDLALSNGNASHLSWFSIFHSQFPYLWKEMQNVGWKIGSPALKLLKKWGYQIHLYSSAQLRYYNMEKLLFGENQYLLDHRHTFHHAPPLQAADSDAAALAKLQNEIRSNPELQQGQLFIIFWDCTHFDYSWPKNWKPKFTPFASESAYFKTFHSAENISLIKNRYRNAVHYMDDLFGKFMNFLPQKEESIVIFTGDHGEEFFERGHLFHGSHISHEQTNVPLYFKFGSGERKIVERSVVSQMDIFPSLLDYLNEGPVDLLEGNSLFQNPKRPYVVTARFNAGRTPYEFSIHNGSNKLIAQFANRREILESEQLQIVSIHDKMDQCIPDGKNCVHGWIKEKFGSAMESLFNQP